MFFQTAFTLDHGEVAPACLDDSSCRLPGSLQGPFPLSPTRFHSYTNFDIIPSDGLFARSV